MGIMMILCPVAKRWIPTGIGIDRRSFEDPTNRFINMGIVCAFCGLTHRWNKQDARLLEPTGAAQ
jgi:hypothetical protein